MRKIHKSRREISQDVKSLLEKNKRVNSLITSIKQYLEASKDNKLVDKLEIRNIFFNAILNQGGAFSKNKKVLKALGYSPSAIEVIINPDMRRKTLNLLNHIKNEPKIIEEKMFYIFEKAIGDRDVKNLYEVEIDELSKLMDILRENQDILYLLFDAFSTHKKQIIFELIKDKELHLSKIKQFIDNNLDLKQNVENLFIKLEKKISKSSLQDALKKVT